MAIQIVQKQRAKETDWEDVLKQAVATAGGTALGQMVASPIMDVSKRYIRDKPAQEAKALEARKASVRKQAQEGWLNVDSAFTRKTVDYSNKVYQTLDQVRKEYSQDSALSVENARASYIARKDAEFLGEINATKALRSLSPEDRKAFAQGDVELDQLGLGREGERSVKDLTNRRNAHLRNRSAEAERYIKAGRGGRVIISAGTPEERRSLQTLVDKRWTMNLRGAIKAAVVNEIYLHEREGLLPKTPAGVKEFKLRLYKRAQDTLRAYTGPISEPLRFGEEATETETTAEVAPEAQAVEPAAASKASLIQGASGDPARGAYAPTGAASVVSVLAGEHSVGPRSQGEAVRGLGAALYAVTGQGVLLNRQGKVDDRFGPGMHAQVKALQKRNGLEQTGVVDQATVKALAKEVQQPANRNRAGKFASEWLGLDVSARTIPADQPIETIGGYPVGSLLAGGSVGAATPAIPQVGASQQDRKRVKAADVKEARFDPSEPLLPLLAAQQRDFTETGYAQSREHLLANIEAARGALKTNLSSSDRKFYEDYIASATATREEQGTAWDTGLRSRIMGGEGEEEAVPYNIKASLNNSAYRDRMMRRQAKRIDGATTQKAKVVQAQTSAAGAIGKLAKLLDTKEMTPDQSIALQGFVEDWSDLAVKKQLTTEQIKSIRDLAVNTVNAMRGQGAVTQSIIDQLNVANFKKLPELIENILSEAQGLEVDVPKKITPDQWSILQTRTIGLLSSTGEVVGAKEPWRLSGDEIEAWLNTGGVTLDPEKASRKLMYIGDENETGETNLRTAEARQIPILLESVYRHIAAKPRIDRTLGILGKTKTGTTESLDELLSEAVRSIIRMSR